MSDFIVVDGEAGWLTARAASISWDKEPGEGDTSGSVAVQLRWMIHPDIGLPLQPFKVWRRRLPVGTRDKQRLANLGGWSLVETVGLPATTGWDDTGYALDGQGPAGQETDALDAAYARLLRGAPRKGWRGQTPGGNQPPAWERPDEARFLKHIAGGHVLRGLAAMLIDEPSPRRHRFYTSEIEAEMPSELLPHLLLDDVIGSVGEDDRPSGSWNPLMLLLMGAATDPLAALAYGFATAVDASFSNEIYMVSVRHTLEPGSGKEIELADIVFPASLHRPVPTPGGLAARRSRVTRPQGVDRAALETTAVTWDRPVRPLLQPPLAAETPFAVAYAIARFGSPPEDILLTPRDYAGGWESYVPGTSPDNEPVAFQDHMHRTHDGTAGGDPYPGQLDVVYAVAGQDLFGRWSDWREVEHTVPPEVPHAPKILSVRIDDGLLVVDFAWDWSDRSPEFIELAGVWTDAPGSVLASVRVKYGGGDEGVCADGSVRALAQDRNPCGWGAEQDKNPSEPGTRFYRWGTRQTIDLSGKASREFGVRGRGQKHLHFLFDPDFGVGPWTAFSRARVWDDRPLPAPAVVAPEAPSWASLPDAVGVSRFTLNWPAVPGAAGYIVYEATETALLDADQSGTDLSAPHHVRLAELRRRNLSGKQRSFRRLNENLETGTSYEVALPRGSRVIHVFAVTTMSANRAEGPWPHNARMFFTVAAPRIVRPPAPGIAVAPGVGGLGGMVVTVDLAGTSGGRIDLYRTIVEAAAADVGSMGPVHASRAGGVDTVSFVDVPLLGQHRYFYRAVVWSLRDDLLGLVESRSKASPAVSITVRRDPGI
ncbi:MAG: hypothetical protein NTV73_08175 [Hyphomicrobiales bacterium]|nr:hypothetical protein [Hyphomicrobiales bacterium]